MTRSPVMMVFSIEPLGTSLLAMIKVFSTKAMSAADTTILIHSKSSFPQPPGCSSFLRDFFFPPSAGSTCGTSTSFSVLPVLTASLCNSCAIFLASSSADCTFSAENASCAWSGFSGCLKLSGSPSQCCPARMPSSPPRSGSFFVLSSLMK